MRIKKIMILLILLAEILYSQNAEQIVSKAEDAIKGETAYGVMEMIVETPDYTRNIKMESWWEGNENALIKIIAPRRESGNKTLKIGNEMWNYLKNTETTIKIPPSMMLQSWNGSDFTNDDLVRESNLAEDYNQKILTEEKVDNKLCWKIELIPKPDAPVVWGKLLYWVSKENILPVKVEYYDENGKLVRYLTFSDVEKVDERKIPTKWTMHNEVKEGNKTTIKIIEMDFNINIPKRKFSFQELERGN